MLLLVIDIIVRFGPRQSTQTAEYSVNGRLWCDFKFAPFAEHSQRSDLRRVRPVCL